MVSSRDLINVPITSVSNRDIVPLGSRMDGLEKTVATLVKSIEDMKTRHVNEVPKVVVVPAEDTFASVVATGTAPPANVNHDRNVNAKKGGGRNNAQSRSQDRSQRQRLPSVKRKNDDDEEETEERVENEEREYFV